MDTMMSPGRSPMKRFFEAAVDAMIYAVFGVAAMYLLAAIFMLLME